MPECQSTNTLLADLTTRSDLPEGTLVITANQTAGRGQRGNTWTVTPGLNLTFSILFKPVFLHPANQFALVIATSLAVSDYLRRKSVYPEIKWPNDVLVQEKKIAGMLIENSIAGETLQQSIVGIGLNINQQEWPIATATSLAMQTKKLYDLREELPILLSVLEERYLALRAGETEDQKKEYLNHLYGIGKALTFDAGGTTFPGTIETIDQAGRLVIRSAEGTRSFSNKEVAFRLPN